MAYWQHILCVAALLYAVGVLTLEQVTLTEDSEQSLQQCRSLYTHFPKLVSFPREVRYEQEQSHYWSVRQTDLKPACRLSPTTSQETSNLVQYLYQQNFDFAVANGGHSTVPGASNLDGGITLDLSSISSISLPTDNASISIGTGARWRDVYQVLDPIGLTVSGARAGSVGAGGFLLGGGISISAPRHGWSCDTLESVEVVLANGSILIVNHTHHAGLFRSLKGGGSNFGIATSFTMRTFPISTLQVAFLRYELHQTSRLMNEISAINSEAHKDPSVSFDLSVALDPSLNKAFGFLMITRFGNISQSNILQPFFDISHSYESVNDVTPGDLADTVDLSNPRAYRQHRCTMTIRNDAHTLIGIARAFGAMFTDGNLLEDDAYRPGMLIQPISLAQLQGAESGNSSNMMGLDKEEEPLLLISFELRWSLPSQDEAHTRQLNELLDYCKEFVANKHHTLHPFVYLNYASAGQDVFELLRSQGRLTELETIRKEYDEKGYLENHLSNPFRLHE